MPPSDVCLYKNAVCVGGHG